MSKKYLALIVCAAAVSFAACDKKDGDDNTAADTSVVQGADTVNVPTAVPTTDTIVKSTETDTIHGEAKDTTKH
ncbi:MAG TPA: hypothetical protein VM100_14525 [Longimicrobiales bacterium]|nr:hypothetical protein [Longimicrobiales bacterium]